VRPAAQVPQSPATSNCVGHVPHAAPVHLFRHVQVQPVVWSPLASDAWPLQFAGDVQTSPHVGKFVRPAAHAEQLPWSYFAGHPLQVLPSHMPAHVQLQPVVVSPETAVAWPEHEAPMVHIVVGAGVGATQDGKLTSPTAQALQSAAES
jgi:hypothetical protein